MMTKPEYQPQPLLMVVLGHTAGGKTAFAAHLAKRYDGEIISADSRQVYRGMDIGTGKDYDDYLVEGEKVNCHLIDIVDAGYEYSVFEFQKDFIRVYNLIREKGHQPVLCGGTGLYLQSVLQGYELISVPLNEELRKGLSDKSVEELTQMLVSFRSLHNTTDVLNRKRLIRAIEIEAFKIRNPSVKMDFPKFSPLVFGIKYAREERRSRITARLKARLENGMIEEAERLISSGIAPERLEFYGLEYKYLSWYLSGKLDYNEMFKGLNTAIHQFAKRQMTWFRKMEREGVKIHWVDGEKSMEEKLKEAIGLISESGYNKNSMG